MAGVVTPTADGLTRILDGFYAKLAAATETSCSHAGRTLSLADNVVLVVNGDTFKNPFNRAGWGDGTVGGSNLVFVRGNGYLRPGWFGEVTPTARTNFDPWTGALQPSTPNAASTLAAQLGVLYAIARGNPAAVGRSSAGPYAGVIEVPGP